jgi:4-hydroxythreonine-4-phosphate dehydrogenase
MNSPISIAVTEGDPAGIGPEIILRALREWKLPADCRLVVAGFSTHFSPTVPIGETVPQFEDWERFFSSPRRSGLHFVSPGPPDLDQFVTPGQGSLAGARAAIRSLDLAIDAALRGEFDALCTAPISKENLRQAGFLYPGHTELLADRTKSEPVAMMLATSALRVVLATIHEPLARVPSLLGVPMLFDLFRLTNESMPDFGVARPRIGVAGLNPHAGEGGLFGREEIEIISPAIELARREGINAMGPFSADTLFHRAVQGEFDVVVAMYHDQGLIPIKTLDFHGGVNITLGLPFVRASPDHGTARDIAGRGAADPRSFIAALDTAYRLASERRNRRGNSP